MKQLSQLSSQERRAWLVKESKEYTIGSNTDVIASIALQEISELDEKIKALESKLEDTHLHARS